MLLAPGGSGGQAASGGAPSFTLSGTLAVPGTSAYSGTGTCSTSGGYTDIREGTSVTVYDAAGAVVASGSLGAGADSPSRSGCVFPLAVSGVPSGAKFYQVEISHRGKLTVPADEARSGGFAATLG
ncbi:hypothetical protein C7C46_08880 [Streptomyces tateyamensis]|uniref:Uncharacterized protein n=1 Tax=Streptomyces tateyamensis TaxID=565073 RepID=A0A2V4NEA4_9ACTN|nr:hypothetical protein C7C46_08880 [Streptomyces tateyamensis]